MNQNLVLDSTNGTAIAYNEIMYINAKDKYVDVYTAKKEIKGYISLKACENQLKSDMFIRPNRSFIVNMNYIRRIKGVIVMNDDAEIAIKRGMIKEFKKQYIYYLQN